MYRSDRGLVTALTILLWVQVACWALNMGLSLMLNASSDTMAILAERSDDASLSTALWMVSWGVLTILTIPVLIATAVVFLIWIHRAFTNLAAIGSEVFTVTPAQAVYTWFIPFLNLYAGYRSMSVLHAHSQPSASPFSGRVLAWWLTFLASNVLLNIATRGDNPDFVLFSYGAAARLTAAILLVGLVRRISRLQAQQNQDQILRAAASAPRPAADIYR